MSVRNAAIGVGAVVLGVGWLSFGREEPTRLTFLAVGQGDCAVFQHQGRTLLVDAGPASPDRFDAGRQIVLPRLRSLGVSRVDLLLLTHPDLDHVGGAGAILSAFPRSQVAVSESFRTNPEMQAHFRQWRLEEWRVVWLPSEAQMVVGDVRIRLHSPKLAPGQDANAGSTFLRLSTGRAAAVLTGDAPRQAEREALRVEDWSAQILKAGHHGSRTSSDETFLRAVRPDWMVISCGRDNPYGHPAREVLELANRAKVKVARTDRQGDLSFELRDGRFAKIDP